MRITIRGRAIAVDRLADRLADLGGEACDANRRRFVLVHDGPLDELHAKLFADVAHCGMRVERFALFDAWLRAEAWTRARTGPDPGGQELRREPDMHPWFADRLDPTVPPDLDLDLALRGCALDVLAVSPGDLPGDVVAGLGEVIGRIAAAADDALPRDAVVRAAAIALDLASTVAADSRPERGFERARILTTATWSAHEALSARRGRPPLRLVLAGLADVLGSVARAARAPTVECDGESALADALLTLVAHTVPIPGETTLVLPSDWT